MRTKIFALLALLALPALVAAQVPGGQVVVNGNAVSLVGKDAATGDVSIVVPNASASYKLYTGGTLRETTTGAGVRSRSAGLESYDVPFVPTMAATPVATTNAFSGVVNIVPTAAANTAALLPAGPTAGMVRRIINGGANTIRIKPGGTNTINGGTAGAYTIAETGVEVTCIASSSTNWICNKLSAAISTPAGP